LGQWWVGGRVGWATEVGVYESADVCIVDFCSRKKECWHIYL